MVQVSDSIINANGFNSTAEDTIKPFTFIEFITKANLGNNESVFLTNYKEYLTSWSNIKNKSGELVNTAELIKSQVISLLKTLTVSFANQEEQKFLSSLNWDFSNLTDPIAKQEAKNSIYSALPLFVSRIKEIALFYKDKRTEATFTISRNKIRGTKKSIEKIIFDKILSFLFSTNSDKISYVQNYLNISINNYVDTYSEYFDIERSENITTEYNDIDPTIYFELESVLADMLFNGDVYLREIPLIASLAIDFSQECVGDMLTLKNELIRTNTLGLIDDNEKVTLKRQLYEKYIGTDFYYLYKDGENYVTDIFIKAENPTNNLLNQQTIDTPYTVSKQLKLLKDIGLFFKPDKLSLLRIDTTNFNYSIDTDKVEEGKLYIFPDPKLYGNVAFNRQVDYPFIIEYSYDEYIKTASFGKAAGDPLVTTDTQALFAYYSREQDINKINRTGVIATEFSDLYNRGFITQVKVDFYGNKFAMFKEKTDKFTNLWTFNPVHPDISESKHGTVEEITTGDGIIKHYYDVSVTNQTQLVDEININPQDKDLTRDDIRMIPGKIYVYNSNLQYTRELDEVIPWLNRNDSRYAYILDNLVSFDIIENTLILKSVDISGKVCYLFDAISFDEGTNSFKRTFSQREPIIFDGTITKYPAFNDKSFSAFNTDFYPINGNIYNKVSEIVHAEALHKCYFVSMTLDMVTTSAGTSYPVICPEVYEINLQKLTSKRYFFYKTNGQNLQQIESFSIPDTLFNAGTVIGYKVSTPSLAFSEDSLTFMLVYAAYDISNCLYIFKHHLKLSESASESDGEIDTNYMDSTIYQPGYSGQVSIIPPSDNNINEGNTNDSESSDKPAVPGDEESGSDTDNYDSINVAFVTNNIIN